MGVYKTHQFSVQYFLFNLFIHPKIQYLTVKSYFFLRYPHKDHRLNAPKVFSHKTQSMHFPQH